MTAGGMSINSEQDTHRDSIESVFVDESGYTGADLLNTDQRVHAVAAVRCTVEHAQEIVDRHFGSVRATELKLSRLVRRRTHRKALIAAMLDVTQGQNAVGYVCCKRYALWLQLIDDCIEPVFHRIGMPFYENGWNRSFASLLFATAPQFWGTVRTEKILKSYQKAARSKQPEDVSEYCDALKELRGCDLAEFFVPAMAGEPDVINSLTCEDGTLDLSHPMALGLVSWLEERSSAPYRIVHDHNRAIGKALGNFRTLAAIEEQKEFKVSSQTNALFPLKFTETVLADSRSDIRLQLADLLAGSVRLCAEMILGYKPNDGLPDELLAGLPPEAFMFTTASLDFAETHASYEGNEGAALIDFIAQELAKRDSGRPHSRPDDSSPAEVDGPAPPGD